MLDSLAFPTSDFHNCGKVVECQTDTPPPRMNLWNEVLLRLEQTVDRSEYETWFAPTTFLAARGDTIEVRVPDERFVDAISDRYSPQIRSILSQLAADRTKIHFVADASAHQQTPAGAAPTPAVEPPTALFNPRYRFNTFVVGNSNQLAYAASLSIAENGRLLSSPLTSTKNP